MNVHYLVDFDLEGDVCECGERIASHPVLPKPSSVTEGRGGRSEADNIFRRYPVFVGPPGEGIQITRPAKPRQAAGRKSSFSDEMFVAAIAASPDATYIEIAQELGVSSAAIYQRITRMEQDGPLPVVVASWRAGRLAKSTAGRHASAGSRW